MKTITTITAITALALTQAASAQFTITPGGANAGNGVFSQGAAATSPASVGLSGANLRPTIATSPDQLFQDAWFFRVANDTREFAFATGSSGGYTLTSALVGNNAGTLDIGGYDHTVTNTAAGTSFTANLRWQIFSNAAGPYVAYTATINNTSIPGVVGDLNISLFHYNDFDANATAATDTYSYSNGVFTVSDGPVTLFHSGNNANAYQAAVFSANRMGLNDALVTNLNNTVVGSPGDYTGAFQWNLTIPAGGSMTIGGVIGYAIPAPGAVALFGFAGLAATRRRR